MTLTVESFKDFNTYKKDLQKTLRVSQSCEYTLIKTTKDKVEGIYMVCGKSHNALLKQAKDYFDSMFVIGSGTFQDSVIQPVKGVFKSTFLKEFGIEKLVTLQNKALSEDEMIPGCGFTLNDFKERVEETEKWVKLLPYPKWTESFEIRIKSAKEYIPQLGTDKVGSDSVTTFITFFESAKKDFAAVQSAIKDINHWTEICTKQAKSIKTALDDEQRKPKPNAEKVEQAQALLERYKEAAIQLSEGRTTLISKPSQLDIGFKKIEQAKSMFKSVTSFEMDDTAAKSNDKDLKFKEALQSSKGLADLYGQYKDGTLKALKSKTGEKEGKLKGKEVMDHSLKLLELLESRTFKESLRSKLDAVDTSADKPIEKRKPLIEKALLTARNYVNSIDELSNKPEVTSATSTLLPLRQTLMHIQSELAKLYTSKILPPQKK